MVIHHRPRVVNQSGDETRFQRLDCFLALWTQGVAP